MLLNAGSSNMFGVVNNPTVNFAPHSSGLFVPPATGSTLNGASSNGLIAGIPANLQVVAGQGALAAPLAQSQTYDQFRLLGVNSQGQGNQPQIFQQLYFMPAFGFGSGTQPNQPWVPNAYNLGLANQQWSFPSQSDLGFQAPAPWYRPTAHYQQADQETPENLLVHDATDDTTAQQLPQADENVDQSNKQWSVPDEESLSLTSSRQEEPAAVDAVFTAAPEEIGIPDSLWLSALAPVPFAALATGLPGFVPSAEPAAPLSNGGGSPE
jgi:hypothetical protein